MTATTLRHDLFTRAGWRRTRAPGDRLLRSSIFLTTTAGVMAGLGFGFSIVAARVFSPAEVGAGTSLIAATTLIAFLGPLGLDGTVVRFTMHAKNYRAQLTQALLVAWALGLTLSAVYVIFVPFYAPELSFVRDNLLYAFCFVIAGAAASANQLTDAVFVGARRPEYNLLLNGLIQGLTKLILPFALVGLGAYGVFGAVGAGYVVALVASVVCLRRILAFRFTYQRKSSIPKEHRRYSVCSYLSNSLYFSPNMALPLIALHALGGADAAYFYLAFQVANTVNGISHAVGQALFAEGSSNESGLINLCKRAVILQAALQMAAVIVVVGGAPFILSAFGREYVTHGQDVLRILTIAAIPVAIGTLATYMLKVLQLMKSLIACNVVFAATTVGLAQLWSDRGLEWLGWAWCAGQTALAICAVTALVVHYRRMRAVDRNLRLAGEDAVTVT